MFFTDNQVSGAYLSRYGYTYDALGRRANRSQFGSAINRASIDTFAYNSRNEVIGASNSVETATEWNPTYSYDEIGNRKESTGFTDATYIANELNQYSLIRTESLSGQVLETNPTYDPDGNLISDGDDWFYTWNNENHLVSARDGRKTLDFTYDYQGRLVKKDDGTTIEVYLYDGWNRIASFDIHSSALTLQSSYLWGLDLSGTMQGAGGVGSFCTVHFSN